MLAPLPHFKTISISFILNFIVDAKITFFCAVNLNDNQIVFSHNGFIDKTDFAPLSKNELAREN